MENLTWCPTARTAADHSGQSPAAAVAAQANLRVVRHRFEGTPQAGNIGSGEGCKDWAKEGSAAVHPGGSSKGVRSGPDGRELHPGCRDGLYEGTRWQTGRLQ